MWASRLKNTAEIREINFGSSESKLSLNADDLRAFCLDYNSVEVLFDVLNIDVLVRYCTKNKNRNIEDWKASRYSDYGWHPPCR